jgi:hypothetical protein
MRSDGARTRARPHRRRPSGARTRGARAPPGAARSGPRRPRSCRAGPTVPPPLRRGVLHSDLGTRGALRAGSRPAPGPAPRPSASCPTSTAPGLRPTRSTTPTRDQCPVGAHVLATRTPGERPGGNDPRRLLVPRGEARQRVEAKAAAGEPAVDEPVRVVDVSGPRPAPRRSCSRAASKRGRAHAGRRTWSRARRCRGAPRARPTAGITKPARPRGLAA